MIGADGGKVQVRGQIESGTNGTSAEAEVTQQQRGQPAEPVVAAVEKNELGQSS